MARSAETTRRQAPGTKAELMVHLDRMAARVAELEQSNAELERTCDALRDSEGRLAALVENLPAVAFVRDLDGRFMLINPAYEKTYGVAGDDVRGKTLGDVLPKAQAKAYAAHDAQVIAEERVIEEEITVVPNGQEHVLSAVKFPVRNAAGETIAVGGIELDITKRKTAEQEVEQNEARFRAILESSPAGIVVTLRDSGEVVYANARIAELLMLGDDREMGKVLNDYWTDPKERDEIIGLARRGEVVQDVAVRRVQP